MRKSLALLATAAVAVTLAGPSTAAVKKPAPKLPKAKPLVIVDQAGDSNGLNDQTGILPAGGDGTAAPGQRSSTDILSVTYGRLDDGKKVTALVVSMKLSAAPDTAAMYQVLGSTGDCSTFWFQYGNPGTGFTATLRHNCPGAGSTASSTSSVPVDAVVKDATITWTVPIDKLPAPIKLGTAISDIRGVAKGYIVAATVPVMDQTKIEAGPYKIGQ